MTVLVDHDLEGYARRIWGVLTSEGWLDLLSLPMTTFRDEGLAVNSNDRLIWRYAQEHGMLLLTGNRNMDGDDSLEQTLREENTPTSLPVITVGDVDRLAESGYRIRCAHRLVELVLYLERYRGVGRLFIP
jgi:hypothetical protein